MMDEKPGKPEDAPSSPPADQEIEQKKEARASANDALFPASVRESNPNGINSKRIAKGVVVIVGGASFIYTVIQIYAWFTQSSGPQIVITARESDFSLPDALWKFSESELKKAGLQDYEANRVKSEYFWLNNFVRITIRNSGDLPADNVRILTGDAMSGGVATVVRNDGTRESTDYTNEIRIGQLEVEDSIRVLVWPRFQVGDELVLTHSTGRVAATVRQRFPSPTRMLVTVIVVVFVVILILAFIADYFFTKQQVRELTSPTHQQSEGGSESSTDFQNST